jgi:hypothetical protein
MTYVDQTPDKDTKISLIKTLQTVTEGKVGDSAEAGQHLLGRLLVQQLTGTVNRQHAVP